MKKAIFYAGGLIDILLLLIACGTAIEQPIIALIAMICFGIISNRLSRYFVYED